MTITKSDKQRNDSESGSDNNNMIVSFKRSYFLSGAMQNTKGMIKLIAVIVIITKRF